jgi:hypothetical protein
VHLAGHHIDDRHRAAGPVDEQLVARQMRLPHRRREALTPFPIGLTVPRAAINIDGLGLSTRARHQHVPVVTAEGMDRRAGIATGAEEVDHHVVLADAAFGRNRYLMRPFSVDHALAELALAVDHGASIKVVAARSALLAGRTAERSCGRTSGGERA